LTFYFYILTSPLYIFLLKTKGERDIINELRGRYMINDMLIIYAYIKGEKLEFLNAYVKC